MKFLATTLLALAHGAKANELSTSDLNSMVESGKIDKQRLLRNSIPVSRKMTNYYSSGNSQYNTNYYNAGNNNANTYNYSENVQYGYTYNSSGRSYNIDGDAWQADLPFTGNYTVRFNKCLSFAVEDEEFLSNTALGYYASTGVIVSQKSYVLFDIQQCQPGSCVFDESDLSKIHIVPLEDFVYSFIEYFPDQREAYCEQCDKHYNYCTLGSGSYYDNAVFQNGGAFCYSGSQYKMINCAQCWKSGCYGDEGDETDEVSDWVEEMASCKKTQTSWQGYPLYTGLTCNYAGDGVEFGVFVDEDCKRYHKTKAFSKVVAQGDWKLLSQSPSLIENIFTTSMTCREEGEIKYMNAYQPIYGTDGSSSSYEDGDFDAEVKASGNDCGIGDTINESCLDLFQGNVMAYSLADCLSTIPEWAYHTDGNNQGYYGQGYNESIDAGWSKSGLYKYELSTSELNDMGKVCHLIANKYAYFASGGTAGSLFSSYNAQHQNVFNEGGSGSMFDYEVAKSDYISKESHDMVVNPWGMSQHDRLSLAEKITFTFLGLVGAALMIFAAVRVYRTKKGKKVEIVDKNLPLMS